MGAWGFLTILEMLNENVKKYLLALARKSIAEKLEIKIDPARIVERPSGEGSEVLGEKMGVFVTLEIGGRLRGCIGYIVGFEPLEKGVTDNAFSAAFEDPRFDPLSRKEFAEIEIEISVLSVPKELKYNSPEDLKEKLRAGIDGVVLSEGFYKATYLPQVWGTFAEELGGDVTDDQLKEQFLSSLCVKAGLSPDEWMGGKLKVEVYQAEVFK